MEKFARISIYFITVYIDQNFFSDYSKYNFYIFQDINGLCVDTIILRLPLYFLWFIIKWILFTTNITKNIIISQYHLIISLLIQITEWILSNLKIKKKSHLFDDYPKNNSRILCVRQIILEKFKIGAIFMHFLIPSSSVTRCNRRLASGTHSGKMECSSFIKKEFSRRMG